MRQIVFACLVLSCSVLPAQPTVHEQVDQQIAKVAGRGPVLCNDAEFVRRLYLDLIGRIPTADEARNFLSDTALDKRVKLIDQLLASPEHPRRMAEAFQVMLMERLGDNPEWAKFLRHSFEKNKPWDQLVREILSPNADDAETRGSAFFLSKRLENYGQQAIDMPGLTRDVGRLFLGVDLQCCQCHDHLFIEDYKQVDFQGLHTFLAHTSIRSDMKFPAIAEKVVDKKTEFMSVFKKEPKTTGPRLPFGTEVEVPTFPKGEEFAVAPDRAKNLPGQPKFSPLTILSQQLPAPENTRFSRNAVNRVWFLLLGRGLVHPLDLSHSANPPSHPEVLELLAREFTAHKFDLRWLMKELAQTQAYQAAGEVSATDANLKPETFLVALEKPLSAEQFLLSVLQSTGELARLKAAKPDAGDALIPDDLRAKFVKAFANPPREPEVEFAPSVKGALFIMNDDVVLNWLKPAGGNLIERLAATTEPDKLADELYLSILSRLPTAEERAELAAHLTANPDRPVALGQYAWALLASTEFAVNH